MFLLRLGPLSKGDIARLSSIIALFEPVTLSVKRSTYKDDEWFPIVLGDPWGIRCT